MFVSRARGGLLFGLTPSTRRRFVIGSMPLDATLEWTVHAA